MAVTLLHRGVVGNRGLGQQHGAADRVGEEGARRAVCSNKVAEVVAATLDAAEDAEGAAAGEFASQEAVAASIAQTVRQYGCRPPQVEVDLHLPPLPPGVKRRRVQRLNHDSHD